MSRILLLLSVALISCRTTAPTTGKAELGTWGVDLSNRKTEVVPGDDFFVFANGAWLDSYELKPDEKRFGAFRELRDLSEARVRAIIEDLAAASPARGTDDQKIGDLYHGYMDTATLDARGIEPLRADLERIAAIADREQLHALFAERELLRGAAPFVWEIGIDNENPDRYLLDLEHGGLGLPDRDYYLEDNERFAEVRRAYEKHIARVLAFTNADDTAASARAVVALERSLAEHHWSRTELRDADETYNLRSIDKLETEIPGFPWRGLLDGAGFGAASEVNLVAPSAMAPLVEVVNATPLETWKAYLTYHLVANNAHLLSREIDDAQFDFAGRVLNGLEAQRERWKRGVELVNGGYGRTALGEAVARIYVERHFPPIAKEKMDTLVENLRRAFRERILDLPWMGEETKKAALEKLAAFRPKVGYPNAWRDFSSVSVSRDDLFANIKALRTYWHQDIISRLNAPTDKDEWFMTAHSVNAYYNPRFNEIVFPAGILQPPFFDPNADAAVNYGAIGAVIGHEMGHGFDDQGSKSDARGIQRNWWTDDDRARFEARTKGLVAQYDAYQPLPEHRVNGAFTLGENIGDLGGLSIALHAYRLSLEGKEAPVIDGFTGDQRFFLAWAQVWRAKNRPEYLIRRLKDDPHSPESLRVNGVVRNMDSWYQAFGVGEGQALYLPPGERVRIW